MDKTNSAEALSTFIKRLECLPSAEDVLKESVDNYQKIKQQNVKKLNENLDTSLNLIASLNHYTKNAQESHERLTEWEKEKENLDGHEVDVKSENCELEKQLQSIKQLLKEATCEKDKVLQQNIIAQQKIKDDHAHAQNIELTQKYLGLEFRTLKNNRIQILFHNAIDNKPDMILFVIIQLVNKVYFVQDSQPELDNLKSLESRLNETNDLSGFVLSIRDQLKDAALRELE